MLGVSAFMAVERKDEQFGGRVLVRILPSILIPSFFVLPVVLTADSPMKTWQIVVCVAGPLTTAVSACWLMYRLHSRYCCPQCGARLPSKRTEAASRYEYRFYCQRCDIIWTTGVFQGEN
jgi:hypothetical protein